MASRPTKAMVLAAGLGLRMRPLTIDRPKPLLPIARKPMIEHVLDALAAGGVEMAVVNVHYLANQVERALKSRTRPSIVISDEREELLDTGGGVAKALPKLGDAPFFVCNSDSLCIAGAGNNFSRMAGLWDDERMDCLMLLAPAATSVGYDGPGDFAMAPDGVLRRRKEREIVPFAFTGTSLASPRLFRDAPAGAFSLNLLWDRAIEAGRLYGLRLDGLWMHVGTPDALARAERALTTGEHDF